METDWDADYQDIVPPFGDSYGVVKHAITDDMLQLEFNYFNVTLSGKSYLRQQHGL